MTFKKFHNILYFNIFRLHCFCQYWVAKPIFRFASLIGLDETLSRYHGREDWADHGIHEVLNDPKGGVSLFLTDRFMGMMEAAFVVTFWNLISALLQLDFYIWRYGMYFLMVIAVVTIFISHTPDYLNDFRKFRSWSDAENRKFAIITLLVVAGIFLALVGSLALYISIAINNKS